MVETQIDPGITKPTIVFHLYNPYEAVLPGNKVISREALVLIKILRSQGFEVVVEPNNDKPVRYMFRKGLEDLLKDPIVLTLLHISRDVLIGIIGSWLYDLLKDSNKKPKVKLGIEIEKNGRKLYFDHQGNQISDKDFNFLIEILKGQSRRFSESLNVVCPNLDYRRPLRLEHSEKIVGWVKDLINVEDGLAIGDFIITDPSTKTRYTLGELHGFSIAGLAIKTQCSVCKKEYTECNHIAGKIYGGVECINHILTSEIVDVSIVKEPVNQFTKIKQKRKIKPRGK